jgi:hypothetical protein
MVDPAFQKVWWTVTQDAMLGYIVSRLETEIDFIEEAMMETEFYGSSKRLEASFWICGKVVLCFSILPTDDVMLQNIYVPEYFRALA